MKLSIIDIGTQSIKHYIFDCTNSGNTLIAYKRYSGANLGESSVLSPETIERNIGILQMCIERNAAEGVGQLRLVGTDILRKAQNANDFIVPVQKISGQTIEIICQEREALYLYKAFLDFVPESMKFSAVNIGGGSTECVVGTKQSLISSVKLPFGAKFIRTTFGDHDHIDWQKLDEYLDEAVQVNDGVDELFITGVLDYMTAIRPLLEFESDTCTYPSHPISLPIQRWRDWLIALRTTPLDAQKNYYTKDPQFCDGFGIGQSVYYAFAKKLGAQRIIPSSRDLVDGILYDAFTHLRK
ncbi:MAG: hypothetical protein AAB400_01785 [Patescibacteria group bacterium]